MINAAVVGLGTWGKTMVESLVGSDLMRFSALQTRTVTPDVGKTVREYKAGKVEFRNDAGGIVHAVVGKLSFDNKKLTENIQSFIHHVTGMKPSSVKGHYIKSISVSATMSPSVHIAA